MKEVNIKVLITGANGFVGSHLFQKLLNETKHEIFLLLRNPEQFNRFNSPRVHLIKGDLQHLPEVEPLFSDLDIVVHSAGLVHSFEKEDFYRVNTIGTEKLIACLNQSLLSEKKDHLRFIHLSSLAARGPNDHFNPQRPLDLPTSHYGRSKLESEKILQNQTAHPWQYCVIRPPMVIGPLDQAIFDVFKMVKDRFLLMPGLKADQKIYSFVHVQDLVESINRLIHLNPTEFKNFHRSIIYTASIHQVTFLELVSEMQKLMNIKKVYHLYLPEFLIRAFAYALYGLHKFFPIKLRMTPDKLQELFPSGWSVIKTHSEINAETNPETCAEASPETQRRHYFLNQRNLKETLNDAYQSYLEKKWL